MSDMSLDNFDECTLPVHAIISKHSVRHTRIWHFLFQLVETRYMIVGWWHIDLLISTYFFDCFYCANCIPLFINRLTTVATFDPLR